MLRIWIFFNKQTIYLEETTAQRKNQIAERAGANLGRSHSWKYRHPQQSTYPWEVFSADLFAIFKAIYWGNCTWFNLSRLTAPFIWFREFELNYGYLMTYCFFQKISGREIAGVWKLSWWPLTEVQDIFKDGAKCRRVMWTHHHTEMVC